LSEIYCKWFLSQIFSIVLAAAGTKDVRTGVESEVSTCIANRWSAIGTGFYDGIGANNFEMFRGSVKLTIPPN